MFEGLNLLMQLVFPYTACQYLRSFQSSRKCSSCIEIPLPLPASWVPVQQYLTVCAAVHSLVWCFALVAASHYESEVACGGLQHEVNP